MIRIFLALNFVIFTLFSSVPSRAATNIPASGIYQANEELRLKLQEMDFVSMQLYEAEPPYTSRLPPSPCNAKFAGAGEKTGCGD